MSLVDALQVSPARSRRRKKSTGAMYSPKMSGGVRVEVTLLDGRKLEFSVGARLLTQDLMSLVTSHFSLCESQYFALAYKDANGYCHWLLDDRRLLDHDFARGVRVLPLNFLVRFFPENVTELKDAQTVEMFYQNARNIVGNGELEVDNSTAVRLAALSLQASIGNFIDEATSKNCLKSSFLSSANLLEHALKHFSEEKVVGEHQQLIGLSRGDAILSYMRQIECLPGYGVHFYEVRDRSNVPWHLGISQKGILQYEFKSRKKPKRVFFWKQLENLYFRERKFSIEVHDPKRVVLALNSFNLYERAIEDSVLLQDDLLEAITEDTTQVSVSRRTFGPGSVSVCVWFAETQSLCKSIWSMAIAQHQFYLDRKTSRSKEGLLKVLQDPPDLAGELSRSCISLSTHSSSPNLSRSGSHSSLQHNTEESASTESLHAARMEMLAALQQRYDSLHEKLEEKSEELKLLCLREGELTGELPLDYPRKPGEPLPVVRKRVGTAFSLDEALINRIINKQEETVASLELEYDIQAKIVSAGLRLANESSMRKGLRKQRKHSYYQATQRLLEIEQKLRQAKSRQAHVIANNASTMPKMKKKPRPVSDSEGLQDDAVPLNAHESLKETSFIDGVTLSPSSNSSQSFSYIAQSKSKCNDSVTLHSAPPSPQRNSLGQISTSDCSSGQPSSTGSRSNSPARPSSGYIPSVVYTRNQYRAQHYPTLSTRGQSMPSENLQHQRSFNGGLYNLPQQRTSLASHSLDDLDSSNPSSPLLNSAKTPSHGHLPPHPHNSSYSNQQHIKQPTPNSQPHNRRPKNDSHDRYGSLDRRRATSGRFESRSMEHLDSFPPSPTTQIPTNGINLSCYSPHPLHDLSYSHDPSEVQPHSIMLHSTSQNFSNCSGESADVADGFVKCSSEYLPRGAYSGHSPQILEGQLSKDVMSVQDMNGRSSTQRLIRSQSGRSYAVPLDACISSTGIESHFGGDTPPFATNQENIPPSLASQPAAELLPPLRASNFRHPNKREGYSTNLRPTASVNAADHLRPFRIPATDLPPLRPTKSSSELPPLKPTNARLYSSSNNSPYYLSVSERSREVNNDEYPSKHRTPSDSTPKFADCSSNDQNWRPNGLTNEPPLMSLAEGAWLKKEQQRIRSDNANDSSKFLNDSSHSHRHFETKLHEHRMPSASHSVHNLSTSSSGSSGSVFHSTNEGSDSMNSTLNTSSLNASLNATLTVISAGSYQPSREISKPFEMSDFYKYSTKFRRKSSTGGSTGLENGMSEPNSPTINGNPLSPHLPPKMSMMLSSTPNASSVHILPPPSPSLIAQNSSPAPQQKGLYQPLTPLTCKPLDEETPDISENHINKTSRGSWEHSAIHQAVPVNVTAKRSATLV